MEIFNLTDSQLRDLTKPLLTQLAHDIDYVCCVRRETEIATVWKQRTTENDNEYIGMVTVKPTDKGLEVCAAGLY